MIYSQLLIILLIIVVILYCYSKTLPIESKRHSHSRRLDQIIKKQESILNKLRTKLSVEHMDNVNEVDDDAEPNKATVATTATSIPFNDPVNVRDNMVINDRLYPPLARTERPTFDTIMAYFYNNPDIFNMNTRGPPDTFRVLGYLTSKNLNSPDLNNTYMLYGRATYPNSDIGEFYLTSTNKISDIKIPLDNKNSNIRRIWDIPNEVVLNSPMIKGVFNYTELPKANLGIQPYV